MIATRLALCFAAPLTTAGFCQELAELYRSAEGLRDRDEAAAGEHSRRRHRHGNEKLGQRQKQSSSVSRPPESVHRTYG